MATEWGVTPMTVQNLCRNGRIEGAVKRAGAWFVPDGTPNPLRNTKSNAEPFKFVGTKKRIFDNSIELFMLRGFENVSINDIADTVGIKQSAVYNHFPSKQAILDTIYEFYSYHFLLERPPLEDIEPILRNGSLIDIITCVIYEFKGDNVNQLMLQITKIIYHRQGIDERARGLAKSLIMENGIDFAEKVYKRAIEIGRIAPFDTYTLAMFLNILRVYILNSAIVDPSPESTKRKEEVEETLYKLAAEHLTDLNPPNKDE